MNHPRRTVSYGAVNLAQSSSKLPDTKIDEDSPDERSYSLSTSLLPHENNAEVTDDQLQSMENLHRKMMAPPYMFVSTESLVSDIAVKRQASVVEPGAPTGHFKLSHKNKLTIGMLAAANLASTVVFSCIAPFFPEEAKKKGATETQTGFVFGIFELVIFIASPFFGRYITTIGSKFMYGSGLCSAGVTAILFGLLNLAPPGTTFIVLCFVIRCFEAVAVSAFITASFAITAYAFPTRVATVIGVLETFSGLGFTVGPPIGGALYQLGGFQLPFFVLGSFLIVAGLCTFFVIPKQDDRPQEGGKSHGSVYSLLCYPEIDLMVFCIIVTAATLSFLDPTLEPHLSSFNLSPFLVGLMFLLTGGVYTMTAPFWGFLIDKKNCGRQVMVLGSFCGFVSLLFIGPSPIFGIPKTLWIIGISQVILGFGIGALYIPPFHFCLQSLRKRGYGEGFATYGLVSGIFEASMSFGAFLGPTLGGLAVEHVGFAWSTTGLAFMFLATGVVLSIYLFVEYRETKKKKYTLIAESTGSLHNPK